MTDANPNPEAKTSSSPSGRPRTLALLALGLVAGAALGGGAVLWSGHLRAADPAGDAAAPRAEAPAKPSYQCPMHPTIVQDHPGDCPICGMKLVLVDAASQVPTGAAASRDRSGEPVKAQWQCPMHPSVVQDHPGDCPICGMKLVKVEGPGGADPATAPTPGGLAAVTIEPARQQLIGLRTTKVTRGQVGGAWRTAGRVAIDETRVHHVNVKVGGFVDHDHASFVGKQVRKGDPLFSLYSPELLAAQEEYLLALRTRKTLGEAGATREGDALVAASRRKLQLWDVSEAELERLERTGQATKNLMFHAPTSGVVTKRDVVPGMRIEAGAMPYEIVDLSRVWVLADVYESELRSVKVGLRASLTLKAYPNRRFEGRVAFVDPMLDPKTRTVKVRLEFDNRSGELKPEMFGEVVLEGASREGLVVPPDAVVDSGTTRVVFVALGGGKFQPREVGVGAGDGQRVEVTSGLHEGEEVVTGANFLVDSESRLRASLAAMTSGKAKTPTKAATGATGGASAPAPAPAADPHAGHGGR